VETPKEAFRYKCQSHVDLLRSGQGQLQKSFAKIEQPSTGLAVEEDLMDDMLKLHASIALQILGSNFGGILAELPDDLLEELRMYEKRGLSALQEVVANDEG